MTRLDPRDPYGLDFIARQDPLNRNAKRGIKAFGAWFVFCALLSLACIGVVLWAIIALVTHYT